MWKRVKIAWHAAGDGQAVLLIQGLGYGAWGWEPVVPGLAEHSRVLTFDNRGVGASDKPAGPYSVYELATDALQVLDEAGVERAHLVGASLGGMVAQQLAASAPERVGRLVLCGTSPGGAESLPVPEPTMRLLQEVKDLPPEVAVRRFVENALGPEATGELVDDLARRRLVDPPDPAGWHAQIAALTGFSGAGPIAVPTLVLHGDADTMVDPRNADLLAARIPQARVEIFHGAGHLFYWERPDEFIRVVSEFIGTPVVEMRKDVRR